MAQKLITAVPERCPLPNDVSDAAAVQGALVVLALAAETDETLEAPDAAYPESVCLVETQPMAVALKHKELTLEEWAEGLQKPKI